MDEINPIIQFCYLVGTVSLVALGVYLLLALRGHSELIVMPVWRTSFEKSEIVPWMTVILAGLCLVFILFTGIHRILGWMPYSWGGLDDDGDFRPLRDGISAVGAVVGAVTIMSNAVGNVAKGMKLHGAEIRIRHLERARGAWDEADKLKHEVISLEKFLTDIKERGYSPDREFSSYRVDDDPYGLLRGTYISILAETMRRCVELETLGPNGITHKMAEERLDEGARKLGDFRRSLVTRKDLRVL